MGLLDQKQEEKKSTLFVSDSFLVFAFMFKYACTCMLHRYI